MSKPQSSVSSAVSIRVNNDLLDLIREYAIANNLINNSGRSDKRGEPNLSQAFSELAKIALGNVSYTMSDSVSNTDNVELEQTIKKLCDSVTSLSDRMITLSDRIDSLETAKTLAASGSLLEVMPLEDNLTLSEGIESVEAIATPQKPKPKPETKPRPKPKPKADVIATYTRQNLESMTAVQIKEIYAETFQEKGTRPIPTRIATKQQMIDAILSKDIV